MGRKSVVLLTLAVFPLLVQPVVVDAAQIETAVAEIAPVPVAVRTDVRLNQKCTRKYATNGTKFMCLPRARGTGLVWQRYPKAKRLCPRKGMKVPSLALTCTYITFTGSVRGARNYWMAPPSPFSTRGIYGDEWVAKIGQECSLHQLTLERGLFQGVLRGLYTTCLPIADGSLWTWQDSYPKLNGSCARIGHRYGTFVCAKVGSKKKWTKAARGSVDRDAIMAEIMRFMAHQRSTSMWDWSQQVEQFMNTSWGLMMGPIGELNARASLAGVSVKYSSITSPFMFETRVSGVSTCWMIGNGDTLGQRWGWWGSTRDIEQVPCTFSEQSARDAIVAELVGYERQLRMTDDVTAQSARLMKLRSYSNKLLTFYDGNSEKASVYWKYTLGAGGHIASSTYKIGTHGRGQESNKDVFKCYAGGWDGNNASLSEVACA